MEEEAARRKRDKNTLRGQEWRSARKGGLNSPKNAWNEKENGDCKTELAAGTIVELKQEPALITDPNSDVGKCI
ncbi:hypothetical protein TNCV_3989351 [Trichonephila clavipes]|nr:hypothetical protein TNCV_3989351 [Trichonephila clavipes]